MYRRLFFCGLAATLLRAETLSMAASGDGAIFRFQSKWTLRGTGASDRGLEKVFELRPALRLVQQTIDQRAMWGPLISADGRTQGVVTQSPCFGPCTLPRPTHGVQLQRGERSFQFSGNAFRLSRNGRFLFSSGFPNFDRTPRLMDLDSGEEKTFGNVLSYSYRHAISDTGTLLSTEPGLFAGIGNLRSYRELRLTEWGKPHRVLYQGGSIAEAAIDASGTCVYAIEVVGPGEEQQLLRMRVEGGAPEVLWRGVGAMKGISLNRQGTLLLVQREKEVLLWEAGRGWESLLTHDEGIAETLLTDDGNVAFVMTRAGRILAMERGSGRLQELAAPLPTNVMQRSRGTYPGSLLRLEPNWQSEALELTVRGVRLPLVKLDGPYWDVQLPWEAVELTESPRMIGVVSHPASAFELSIDLWMDNTPRPWIFDDVDAGTGRRSVVAAREGFTGMVSKENPAPAGGLIHIWMAGLGPLDRAVRTGEPGPAEPPARPKLAIACSISSPEQQPAARGLEVPTLIYAPNLVGVYQADVRIPEDWPAGEAWLMCAGSDGMGSGATLPVGARR